jgi:hypothetical protein
MQGAEINSAAPHIVNMQARSLFKQRSSWDEICILRGVHVTFDEYVCQTAYFFHSR